MAAEASELDPETRELCRRLVNRLDLKAPRATIEIVVESGSVKELFRKERFTSDELRQFDPPDELA